MQVPTICSDIRRETGEVPGHFLCNDDILRRDRYNFFKFGNVGGFDGGKERVDVCHDGGMIAGISEDDSEAMLNLRDSNLRDMIN